MASGRAVRERGALPPGCLFTQHRERACSKAKVDERARERTLEQTENSAIDDTFGTQHTAGERVIECRDRSKSAEVAGSMSQLRERERGASVALMKLSRASDAGIRWQRALLLTLIRLVRRDALISVTR